MSKKAMKDEVCVMAAAGMLGGSFDLTAFNTALQYNPDVIGLIPEPVTRVHFSWEQVFRE